MTLEAFKQVIKLIRLNIKYASKLSEAGVDLYENKYPIGTICERLCDVFFGEIYNTYGLDWINWFIYENDCGNAKMGAWDGTELICQTVEETYNYIKQYEKRDI